MVTPPTTEIGSVDALPTWGAFTNVVTSDRTEPFAWHPGPSRVATVNRMRVDAQVDSLCNSVTMPVMRMKWELNPNGARDEVVEQVSTDLGIPIQGYTGAIPRSRRRFKHRDHLEHALLALWYGHMFFEQVPDTENYDLATDGWRLRKLAPRMPGSIDRIHIAKDGGLSGITQAGWVNPVAPRRRGQGLGIATLDVPQIPVSSLAAYVWKREGSDWSGRSMLRPLYRDWLLKDRALRVDAIKNERFGVGIPTATAPAGGDPNQYAKLAQSIRAAEFGGVGLEAGASIGIEGIRGTLPDVLASIRYYDESMARAFMAMVVQLGQTQTGSRALGETFADFFQMLVEAVADWYRDTTNEHVIEDLVDWNFGIEEAAPLIEWSYPSGEQTLAITELTQLVQAGVITMDRETEAAIRQRTRLPMLPELDDTATGWLDTAASSPFTNVGLPALVAANIISEDEARALIGMTGPAPTPSQVAAFVEARHPEIRPHVVKGALASARKQTLGEPSVGHRPPNAVELAAGTDFETLQRQWTDATADAVAEWRDKVQSEQIKELIAQARAAAEAGDLVALSQLQASSLGVEILQGNLAALAEDAVVAARAEAAAQGVSIGTINTGEAINPFVQARAQATSDLLARGISESASRFATNLGTDIGADALETALQEHLDGLSDAYLNDMLGGAMTQAQNTGRRAVMAQRPARIYASELLDQNTCTVCAGNDETEYASLAAAELDYPTGGHKGCLGGPRCRGTLVAVYAEGDDAITEPEPEPGEPKGIGEIPPGFGGELSGQSGKATKRWRELRAGKDQTTGFENLDDRTTRFDYKDGSLTVIKTGDRSYLVEWDEKNFKPEALGSGITTDVIPTRAENRAVRYYQGSYNGTINRHLRLGEDLHDPEHGTVQIDALDSLMAKSSVQNDLTVFRGGFLPDGLKEGSVFTDAGFVSTTTDTAVAARFARNGPLFEIRVKEGDAGVFLAKRSSGSSESELLLNRGTQFRVVEIRGDRTILETYNG